jgi:hypothetical protein
MEATVLRHDNSGSVLVQKGEFTAWLDVWVNDKYKEVCMDWNQYIFDTRNSIDRFQQKQQDIVENWETMSSTALAYLEELGVLSQNKEGEWAWHKENLKQELCPE